MFAKRDPIFWTATGIFAVSLVLAMAVDNGFLLLMVAAYLLRPTLHSLGFFRKLVDERQLQIQYQAGNVAFAAMVIGNIAVMLYLSGKGDHTFEMVNAVLLIGLTVRALAGLLMVGDPSVAGARIVMAVGGLLALFGVLEGEWPGAIGHAVPGLMMVGLGIASRRAPKIVAGLTFMIAAALFALIAYRATASHSVVQWSAIATILLVVAPVVVAGFCLLRGAAGIPDESVPSVAFGASSNAPSARHSP